MSPRLSDVDCSVTPRALSVFVISSALTYLRFSGNVPLLHMSTQRPGMSLHVRSLGQSDNAGTKGLGMKLTVSQQYSVLWDM